MENGARPLLEVKDLKTCFNTEYGQVIAVDGISFSLNKGETLGMVGESGCGKSVASLSIIRLIQYPPGRIMGGSVIFENDDLLTKSEARMRRIRGNQISMIFQEPMTSLNPLFTIGDQIMEVIMLHQRMKRPQARQKAVDILKMVGIPSPESRVNEYPHQMSGGMRQRVMIAMALACNPKLLIADEPTTALDVTIQAQILELIKKLKDELGMAVILITHDLGVVADVADKVAVMYAGKIVESAKTSTIFKNPRHPYTIGLLQSIPKLNEQREKLQTIEGAVPNPHRMPPGCRFHPRCIYRMDICLKSEPILTNLGEGHSVACWYAQAATSQPAEKRAVVAQVLRAPAKTDPKSKKTSHPDGEILLDVKNLVKHFPVGKRLSSIRRGGSVRAVDGLSFFIKREETLGLVGESGCGKSTTGRLISRLIEKTSGDITFNGVDISKLGRKELRTLKKSMQMIFQDPYASLNPRMTIGEIIGEPLKIHRVAENGTTLKKRVIDILEVVGLSAHHFGRYPHEFSGGQRQRIGVARALALNPQLIICDEPVSALDVSIQAQIINLLKDLQAEFGLTYLFIAHDLSVIQHMSDRVAVMYLGKIVELADKSHLYDAPLHPYTMALLSAIPIPDPELRQKRIILEGDVPSPINPPMGCRFNTRCRYAERACTSQDPPLTDVGGAHYVACWRAGEI
ncbi:MAG: ABC transporter ATP-binding protein [Desulfobacterales bacterium]